MIDFSMDMRSLLDRLHEMKKRGENLEPAFDIMGEIMVSSIDLSFSEEGRHSGDPDSIFGGDQRWAPWSESWRKQRIEMGKGDGKIGTLDGGLVSSLDYRTTNDSLIISSSKEYAEQFHHGKGKQPARPFMVIQKEDLEESMEEISKFLVNGLKDF